MEQSYARPDAPFGLPRWHDRVLRFFALLGLNLVASYAPAVFWLVGLPGTANAGYEFLASPVALVLLSFWVTDAAVALCVLAGFLFLLVALSAGFCRSRSAMVAIPGVLFVLSLLQGLLVTWIVRGIEAIGHS